MTNRFVQFALACLLALALPVQGFAAQAMLFCAPVSHSQAGTHDHHAQAAEAHHAQPGDAQQSPDKAHGKCSACASCCSAAALTTDQPTLATPPLQQAHSASLSHGLERVMTGGIERPPRLARL